MFWGKWGETDSANLSASRAKEIIYLGTLTHGPWCLGLLDLDALVWHCVWCERTEQAFWPCARRKSYILVPWLMSHGGWVSQSLDAMVWQFILGVKVMSFWWQGTWCAGGKVCADILHVPPLERSADFLAGYLSYSKAGQTTSAETDWRCKHSTSFVFKTQRHCFSHIG